MMMNSLKNQKVVFTDILQTLRREEAIEYAKKKGAIIQNFVTDQTDILVLAPKQLDIFGRDIRSRKQIKAEELISQGYEIKIISETDFLNLIDQNNN